jgi:hypothetical protein
MALQQTFTGPAITTDNMHNVQIQGPYDPKVYREFAHSWFKNYTLTVSAPTGWHFVGKPYVNCVKDDQGAFGWNQFDIAHDRFFVTQQNSNYIVATCWAGSRSMIINLACVAEQDSPHVVEEK